MVWVPATAFKDPIRALPIWTSSFLPDCCRLMEARAQAGRAIYDSDAHRGPPDL